MKDILIKPLSPELVGDYLYFFDSMVFTEHPDWKKCYCYSFHFTGPDELWSENRNREAVSQLIGENKMKGYLAYSGSTPIGWCNANDRGNYQRLPKIYALDHDPKAKVCSIVCYLIHPDYRRKGIAGMLLQQVIKDYSFKDYQYLEAYALNSNSSCEKNYVGPLSLYQRHGFQIKKELNHYIVVRKNLNLKK